MQVIVVGDVGVVMEVGVGSGDEIVAVAADNAAGYIVAVVREWQVSWPPLLLPAHLGKLEVAYHWEQDYWAEDAGLRIDASTEGEVVCWNHSCEGGER